MADNSMHRLLQLMQTLRDPDKGCAWDKAQTFGSLVPHTLEEAYEVADCIERGDMESLPDELGDLLFQVVFYAEIGREQGDFDFEHITNLIADKLLRRHPHVFAKQEDITAEEQSLRWEEIKAAERAAKSEDPVGALDDVARNLPGLVRAEKIQKRAARLGFDWPSVQGVRDKLNEELAELDVACKNGSQQEMAEEFGDVLFSCVNLGRFLGLNSEASLGASTQKFMERFRYIEATLAAAGRRIEQESLESLESLWDEAKLDKKNRVSKHP